MSRWRAGRVPALASHRRSLAFLLVAILAGAALGYVGSTLDRNDELVVGYTAGTLSVFARIDGTQIVLGGGDSRTDLADLVGRATLPWQRQIDILVVPGWDDEHAVGALGLVERGQVRRLVVIGEPSANPIWSLLEQHAHAQATEFLSTDRAHRVALAGETELVVAGGSPDSANDNWSIGSLQFRGVHIIYLDAAARAAPALASDVAVPAAAHLVIAARPLETAAIVADIWIAPKPQRSREQLPSGPRFTAEIGNGERLRIQVGDSTLRLPLDRIEAAAPE